MKREWKKLRRNNVGNVDAGECLNYIGGKMLLAIFAWDIGKAGQRRMREKVREMNKKYWDEHREEKKAYNKEYSHVGN